MEKSVIDKLLRHMQWSNSILFNFLSDSTDEVLNLYGWDENWSIGKIANHIVIAQERYVSRLQGITSIKDIYEPHTVEGMKALGIRSAKNDELLNSFSNMEEKDISFNQNGNDVTFSSWTIIAQAIHHATEHRAQIDDVLSFRKVKNINLDLIDIWSFERYKNQINNG